MRSSMFDGGRWTPRRAGLGLGMLLLSRRVIGLFIVGALCCAPKPELGVRYEDFLTSDTFRLTGSGEPKLVDTFCADEQHLALPLGDGDGVMADVTLGENPRLVLSGCMEPAGTHSAEIAVELRGESAASISAEKTWKIRFRGPWKEVALDLGDWAGKPVRLEVRVALEAEQELFLRDFYVRHEVPRLPRAGRPKQVLLISVDDLREDFLGYRGSRHPTPNLDRLAARAQVWSPHYASAHWTKPSHAGLLTGQRGAVHGGNYSDSVLHPGVQTLAQRFHTAGFRTAGLVDNAWLDQRFGFAAGFEEYRSVGWTLSERVRYLVDWIGDHRQEPFFFFLHTFALHSDFHHLPYEAPGVTGATVKDRFGVPDYGCRELICGSQLLAALDQGKLKPLPGEADILRFLYGRGVTAADEALGRLFSDLEELGLLDDMLVVVTSDHGEQFFEHGGLSHNTPWEEIVRVPLIIKWPRGEFAGDRRRTPSSAIDLVPTLARACDLDRTGLPGIDLLRRRGDEPILIDDQVVVVERIKAIFPADGSSSRLYDLAADPGERRDLAAERPAELARLRAILASEQEWATALRLAADRRAASAPPATLSEEEVKQLKALGYLQGGPKRP